MTDFYLAADGESQPTLHVYGEYPTAPLTIGAPQRRVDHSRKTLVSKKALC